MSLNIVDFFLDLLLPSTNNSKEMAVAKFSNPQSLTGDWASFSQHIPIEFRQVLNESGFLLSDFTPFRTPPASSTLHRNFRRIFNDNLIVPTPAYPFSTNISKFLKDCMDKVSNTPNTMFEPPSYLNTKSHIVPEEMFLKSNMKMNCYSQKNSCDMPKEAERGVKLPVTDQVFADLKVERSSRLPKSDRKVDSCTFNFSIELANKKSKELVRRSRKRRRRQKVKNTMCESRTANKPAIDEVDFSVAAVKHSKNNKCAGEKMDLMCDILSNCDNVGSDFIDIFQGDSSNTNVHILLPDMTSLFISVENVSDEDADWDSVTESDWLLPVSEFELSGLFMTNLTVPKRNTSQVRSPRSSHEYSVEAKELDELNTLLSSVNKTWNDATMDLNSQPKLPSKVSFAEGTQLVEICPVEIYDRKGEWEIYARERLRFKHRIKDVEKIIGPCFTVEHRTKVLHRLQGSEL